LGGTFRGLVILGEDVRQRIEAERRALAAVEDPVRGRHKERRELVGLYAVPRRSHLVREPPEPGTRHEHARTRAIRARADWEGCLPRALW